MMVQLQDWIRANMPDEKMFWAKSFEQQVCFFRDGLSYALGMSRDDSMTDKIAVISTHTSKSIELPVVRYALNDAQVIIRDNFYNYKISVDSDKNLALDPRGLFEPTERHSRCYCEGFSDDVIFGSYASDNRRFTIQTGSDHAAWSIFRSIRLALLDG